MPLDRHAKRVLDMIAAGRRAQSVELSAESLRRSMVRLAEAADVRNAPIGSVEDRCVPSSHGLIPIRLYTPADGGAGVAPQTERTPALPGIVYFHGGTGVFGSIATHDGVCRMLANASGCRVVSVEYRLAPEHPFPAGLEDCELATTWVAEHADELRVDRNRLVVAGDSAGATIATVLCQLAARNGSGRPRIALQVLLCPVTDLADESRSRRALAEGYFIERSTLQWAKSVYCAGADPSDPRVSPLRAESLGGLPPAHIHTAEFDPMRDEGESYAAKLAAAGVGVRYSCHLGLIHHFYCLAGVIPQARQAVTAIGESIRNALATAQAA